MKFQMRWIGCAVLHAVLLTDSVLASLVTIGPNGINSDGLTLAGGMPLTGDGIGIGQVELTRPGKRVADGGFDNALNSNTTINPVGVFVRTTGGAGIANMNTDTHAEQVAGIMISTHPTRTGVATQADLYSSATNPVGPNYDQEAAVTANHIATRNGGDIRAINMSFGNPHDATHTVFDGNQHFTQFVDWSASNHDVLYIVSGNQGNMVPIPKDNFNGMTVANAKMVGGVYRQVDPTNILTEDAEGDRTSIALIAPGEDVDVTGLNNIVATVDGTSFAAPHVTGTAALLQQYADDRITAGAARWNANARHHEVMKAVPMNSADKLIDNGTVILPGATNPVPQGGLLGMTRTVVKQDGTSTWLDSFAYDDSLDGVGKFTPLDEEMGAGHLNAGRALTQFDRGEFDSDGADVNRIGWDWGTTSGDGDFNRYRFADELRAESFISITLAWDRKVEFDTDAGTTGQYDSGDTFVEYIDNGIDPPDDTVVNDLDIFLLPKFAASITQAIAASTINVGSLEHLFFQIPDAGEYEFWILQGDEDVGVTQDYAVAWWAVAANPAVVQGDYSGDGIVGIEDYNLWKANFGTANAATDGNGNGIVDAADYTVWRDHLGQMAGSGSAGASPSPVPEPTAAWLMLAGLVCFAGLRRNR